jgi:hypothetical protein
MLSYGHHVVLTHAQFFSEVQRARISYMPGAEHIIIFMGMRVVLVTTIGQ